MSKRGLREGLGLNPIPFWHRQVIKYLTSLKWISVLRYVVLGLFSGGEMKVVVVVWVGGTPAGPSSCPWHQSCSLVRWKHRMPGLEGSSCSCFSVFSLQGRGNWRLREGTRPAQGCTEVAMLRADHSLWNQPGLVCVDFGKVFLLLFPPLGSGTVMPAFRVEQCSGPGAEQAVWY